MAKTPQIRILFSDLLFYGESDALATFHKSKFKYDFKESLEMTRQYQEAWEAKEASILPAMQELFGLEFYKPIIDVTLAPMFVPKSKPLIISFRTEPDQFVDVLTHELFHNLFTDNQYVQHHIYKDMIAHWQKIFGERPPVELVHIPVHAGLKAIFLDVLNEPYRLERDIKDVSVIPAYKAAWEYVEQNDYKEIIKKFKESYRSV